MTEEFAPPPTPDGTPSGTVKRAEFRATPPARRRRGVPRWVAVVMVVGGLVIAAGVVTQIALTVRNGNLAPADVDATGQLHSAQVVSGMCLESIGDSAGSVTAVPCTESHSAEAVTSYTFTGDDWPGDAAAADTVLSYCAGQLGAGGPLAAAADGRSWVAWVPSAATWRHGDRTGLCIVTSQSPWQGKATDVQEHTEA